MYCENCGASLRENAKFCDQCGTQVDAGAETKKYCSNCHAELEPRALFCLECGYRVEAEPRPDPEPQPSPNPIPDSEPQKEERPLKIIAASTTRPVWIFKDRIEVRHAKGKEPDRVVALMKDIAYVQFQKGSIWKNPYIHLFMKDGKKIPLIYAMYSSKSNRELEDIAALIQSCLG